MKTKVVKVLTSCTVQLSEPWHFHSVSGVKVRIVGIRGVTDPEINKAAILELTKLVKDQEISIVEKWFVQGRVLHAVVHLNSKPMWEYIPHRRTYILEPSRKLNPFDQSVLVRVSGGIPPLWENPLARETNLNKLPHFGDISYPTKWWLPKYEKEKKIAEILYCHERDDDRDLERKFQSFFNNPTRTVLVLSGDGGIGKTWFAIHNIIAHRPESTDYAYIDLRGRPKGPDLVVALHRELGQFLDQYINQGPDPIKALHHYLVPIVKPYFNQRKKFDVDGQAVQEKMQDAYYKISSDPARLSDYNDIRLGYYDNSEKRLFVIVDNVDNYSEDEQMMVFEYITRSLFGHEGVRVIIPLRPTSKILINRLDQVLDIIYSNIDLRSPNIDKLLERRISRNINGAEISMDSVMSGSSTTWRQLLSKYLSSDSAYLLRDLCSSETDNAQPAFRDNKKLRHPRFDCRHYIRLFRRIVMSDVIRDYENVASEYFAIHALLLKPGEPLLPQSSYLFNLFDNDLPDQPGNALVRYRVLEYFHSNTDIGALFDAYFRALGPGPRIAKDVVDNFISAGLLIPNVIIEPSIGNEIMRSLSISSAGRRHFAIVRNLWYGICVKTGMHIDASLIKRGEDARRAAKEEVGIENSSLLNYYANYGWISDKDFIEFISMQEDLESKRIGDYQKDQPGMLQQIGNLIENRSSPSDILSEYYGLQLDYWRKKGKSRL